MLRQLLLFISGCFLCCFGLAQPGGPSNLYPLLTSKTDSVKINTLIELSIYHWETNPDSSIWYGKKALLFANQTNMPNQAARSLQVIGVAYDYKGNLDSSLWHLHESVKQYQQLKKLDKESHVTSDIATAWYFRGNYELALRNHLKALKMRQQFGDKKFISISYNNIGLVYRSKKDYKKAIYYYKASLQLKAALQDEKGMINSLMNTGSAFQSGELFDSALHYAKLALQLAQKHNLVNDITACEVNIGAALVKLKQPAQAMDLLLLVENKAAELNEKKILITCYESLGEIFLQRNEPARAKFYFEKGLSTAQSNQRSEAAEVFFRKVARASYAMGEFKQAYDFSDKARTLADTLFNQENNRQMNELAAVYESAEMETRMSKLNAEYKIATTEGNRKKQQNIFLIITSLLFLGLLLITYKAFTTNKKQKELLDQKNKVIEKALEEKEYLVREIHHRVKNNLQMISSLLSLQSNYIKDETALEAVNDSRNRVHSMSLIHQSLYHEENLSAINVQDYTRKLVENLYRSYTIDPEKIKLITAIDPINLDIDTIIPVGLILNELITNCLKYAFPGNASGMIKVKMQQENSMLKIAVYDNGAGLPEHFFDNQHKTFGHKMIQAFLKKLNGTMHIYNEDGTKVDISIQTSTS